MDSLRAYEHEGGLYVIRDVFNDKDKFVGCQYAQIDSTGEITWNDCAEGVMFEDIEPLGVTF